MSEILLKAGTGEVEVIEFIVNQQSYAINVLKVIGIIEIENIVELPKVPEEIRGMMNVRGEMRVVIDLRKVLHGERTLDCSNSLGLLCEFNDAVVVFLVDHVKGIMRINWAEIKQVNEVKQENLVIGSILRNDNIIILLDFEAITIAAQLGKGYDKASYNLGMTSYKERSEKLILVEDSKAIREIVKCALEDSGYEHIKAFTNGQEAYDYIVSLKETLGEKVGNEVDVVITDIEMPAMDGYTLTRKIKEDEVLNKIPVIIFSSLITEELKHKGEEVGADEQINKPSIKELMDIIEKVLSKNS